MYVWQQVKYIGYKQIADINDRYIIFCDIVDKFDYEKNNNFIHFYKKRISYVSASKNETYYVSTNRSIIHNLRNENISPTPEQEMKSKITNILKDWSN